MNVDILWSKILNQIKDDLTSLSYNTWFSETQLYKLENGRWKMEAARSGLVAPSLMRGWISVFAKTPHLAAIG